MPTVLKTIQKATIVLSLLLACHSSQTLANNDAEKAELIRLSHELDALAPILEAAEDRALADTRIRFNYGGLRSDIQAIQDGIRSYVETPGTEPRQFPPLRGDYRR